MAIEILVNYFYPKNIFFHSELRLLNKIGPLRYFSTPQGKIQSAGPGGGGGGRPIGFCRGVDRLKKDRFKPNA